MAKRYQHASKPAGQQASKLAIGAGSNLKVTYLVCPPAATYLEIDRHALHGRSGALDRRYCLAGIASIARIRFGTLHTIV